jgi:polyisoprenoid-binding protein YceI
MATTWTADPAHSEIGFSVKHMMFTKVTGTFDSFEAIVNAEDDFSNAVISGKIDATSVNTRNEQRDGHLKSADFFDVEQFPTIEFSATTAQLSSGKIDGEFTLHGVTKPISLEVEFHGVGADPWGNTKAGFSFSSKINRKDFGLGWNAALEAGGVLVGEEVSLRGEIQLAKAQ